MTKTIKIWLLKIDLTPGFYFVIIWTKTREFVLVKCSTMKISDLRKLKTDILYPAKPGLFNAVQRSG